MESLIDEIKHEVRKFIDKDEPKFKVGQVAFVDNGSNLVSITLLRKHPRMNETNDIMGEVLNGTRVRIVELGSYEAFVETIDGPKLSGWIVESSLHDRIL